MIPFYLQDFDKGLINRQKHASGLPQHACRSTQHVLACAAHAAHSPLHTRGRAAEQPSERTSLGCHLGPPAAKTDRQKMAKLQRPYLCCDRSHIWWLPPTHSLWLLPLTDAHRSMHAYPAAHHALLTLLLLARALLLLVCAMLRVCSYSPCCGPSALARLGGPPAPHETLATWRTCCNVSLKQIKYLEHMLATHVCSHRNICNIQIKYSQHI